MKYNTPSIRQNFALANALLLFIFLMPFKVFAQNNIYDAGISLQEVDSLIICSFVIVVEDTNDVQQLEVKLGSEPGAVNLANAVFNYDVSTGLPAGHSYERHGKTLTLGTGSFSERSTYFGSVRLKNSAGLWSEPFLFIAN
jgi:hypothetical protein